MVKVKRVVIYIFCFTVLFVNMDWLPIHLSYLKHNDWPHKSVDEWWPVWSNVRFWSARILCPPCAPLAEHGYFIPFELHAGIDEQNDLLLKHIPAGYKYEGVFSPSGFWMGQGGIDNGNEWKLVSRAAFWLWWGKETFFWWWLLANDLFSLRLPWWITHLIRFYKWLKRNK